MTALDAPPASPDLGLHATRNLQRKAALAAGGAIDHAGQVRVVPMDDFDLGRTIFGKMQGALPRMVMRDKLAKEVYWSDAAAAEIEARYAASEAARPVPAPDRDLVDFLVEECDFSMEHADGTFLDHLVFCHDYAHKHFPEYSANVALLHSILGTATNTFAMGVEKLPMLRERLTAFEARHVEVFPSILRLFYDGAFLPELRSNLDRLDRLAALRCRRVIDNEPLRVEAEDLWINLNYHLMHFVDFMPAANWGVHRSDPLLQQFRALSAFLDEAGQRRARVEVTFPTEVGRRVGEPATFAGVLAQVIPDGIKGKLARKTIRQYSAAIGHDLSYRLEWS